MYVGRLLANDRYHHFQLVHRFRKSVQREKKEYDGGSDSESVQRTSQARTQNYRRSEPSECSDCRVMAREATTSNAPEKLSSPSHTAVAICDKLL